MPNNDLKYSMFFLSKSTFPAEKGFHLKFLFASLPPLDSSLETKTEETAPERP
jgi:hypothetical protein